MKPERSIIKLKWYHSKIGRSWRKTGIRSEVLVKLGFKNFYLFEKSGEKIKAGDVIANAAKKYITVRDCAKLSAQGIEDVHH